MGTSVGGVTPHNTYVFRKERRQTEKARVSGYTYIYIYFGKRVIYICRYLGGWTLESRMDTGGSGGPRSVDHRAEWWTSKSLTFIGASNSQTCIGELRRWRCRIRLSILCVVRSSSPLRVELGQNGSVCHQHIVALVHGYDRVSYCTRFSFATRHASRARHASPPILNAHRVARHTDG